MSITIEAAAMIDALIDRLRDEVRRMKAENDEQRAEIRRLERENESLWASIHEAQDQLARQARHREE